MAVLTVNTITRAGSLEVSDDLVPASGGGDSFPNTGTEFVLFKNGDASSKTVTLVIQQSVDGQAVASRTVTVAAGKTKMIGPFPPTTYNDGNSRMNLTYSAVTSCSVGVFKLTTS